MRTSDEIIALFNVQKLNDIPLFSGLISVTVPGLEREGLQIRETHRDAAKMARAAASTYRLSKLVAL